VYGVMKCLGPSILLEPRPCLFQRIRIWGHIFLGIEAVFGIILPALPCLYLGTEALFVLFCSAVAGFGQSECMNTYSDRPLLYETNLILPPNPFSFEKTGPRVE